jgi:hypothetical protein
LLIYGVYNAPTLDKKLIYSNTQHTHKYTVSHALSSRQSRLESGRLSEGLGDRDKAEGRVNPAALRACLLRTCRPSSWPRDWREELPVKLADDAGEKGQEVSVAKEGEEALTEYRSLKSGTSTRTLFQTSIGLQDLANAGPQSPPGSLWRHYQRSHQADKGNAGLAELMPPNPRSTKVSPRRWLLGRGSSSCGGMCLKESKTKVPRRQTDKLLVFDGFGIFKIV